MSFDEAARRVMANDQVIISQLVNIIGKHVPIEHWPLIVIEHQKRSFNPELPLEPEVVSAILEEAIADVCPGVSYCDVCGAFHGGERCQSTT